MLILALDTSSAAGSAAIARDGDVLVERAGDGGRTHGQRLPGELMRVLEIAGVALRDVDQFAVCTGPGSFTGLRVGIATMQGLALAQRKLVVAVSAFEALAFRATSDLGPPTAVWIDAHRGEVFATLFDQDGRSVLAPPTSLSPDATLNAWSAALDAHGAIVFAGDGAVRYRDVIAGRLGTRAQVAAAVPPLAGTIARIAAAASGRAVRPHAVVPLYVRRSDAELARDRRQGQ